MKRKIILIGLSLFFVFHTKAQNQRLIFRHITNENGLSQNHGMAVLRDYQGFMWFGTNDGVNKYNGKKIDIYKNDPKDSTSLSSGLITVIYEDIDSNLWIGTRNGLNLYNPDKNNFIRFTNNSTLVIYSIFEDHSRNLLIAASTGLFIFNRKDKTFFPYLADISSTAIYEDKNHSLWVGTRNNGLYHFDRQRKTIKSYSQARISSIVEDEYGNLWVGTWGEGLCLFDRKKEAFTVKHKHDISRAESISADIIYSMCKDRTGNIWVGTENGGLNFFDPAKGTFEKYAYDIKDKNSLSNNSVSAIYIDPIGTLWVGVHRGGFNYCNQRLEKFQVYRQEPCNTGLSNNNIKAFCEDAESKIWIATDGGGVNVFDPAKNSFTYFRHDPKNPNSLAGDVVLTLYKDSQDNMWISTYLEGLDKYDKKKNTFTHYKHDPDNENSLSNNKVWSIFEDSKGNFWVGTEEGGLNLLDRTSGKVTRFHFESENNKSLSSNQVNTIYEDKEKRLWIGTGDGLNLYEPGSGFTRFFSNNKAGTLSSSRVFSILEDKANNLWIGTANGLNLFDPSTGKAKAYTTNDGFQSNVMQAIVEDDHANLWISTLEGLSKFNYNSKKVRNYQIADGLQGNEFIQNAAIKTKSGKMIFGGINGFNFFHPDSVRDNSYLPPVFIVGFQLFNKTVEIGENSPLKKHITEVDEITLSYKQSVFSLEFAALNYLNPEKNQYAYMLEGFDDDWHYVGTQNLATYTNLNAGEYTFKVKASNNDGKWNEQGASINITIIPPFWKTWWFTTLAATMVVSSIFGYIRYQRIKAKRQQAELSAIIDERTREVKAQSAEINKKYEQEKIHNWITQGLASISEVMSKNNKDINTLGLETLKKVVQYIDAPQGIIALGVKDPNDEYLTILATYGINKNSFKTDRIEIGEGLLGETYRKKEKRIITNIPTGYFKIESGLGSALPSKIILMPLRTDDGEVIGVMELAFFETATEIIEDFLDKVASLMALNFYAVTLTHKAMTLLQQSTEQAEQMREQEEEMRQNMEELEATQEEFRRRELEYQRKIEELKSEK